MELLLGVLLLVGIIFLAARYFGDFDSHEVVEKETRRPFQIAKRPATFDKSTSKPVQSKPVIKGRAYIVDGDTIKINKVQIRLFGIDAPELNHPYGQKAKWELVKLCKGKVVRAELTDRDAYGRTVARCTLDDGRSGPWTRDGQISHGSGMFAVICLIKPERLDGLLEAAFEVVEKHIGVVSITDTEILRAERF